jgi:hypothetical protein
MARKPAKRKPKSAAGKPGRSAAGNGGLQKQAIAGQKTSQAAPKISLQLARSKRTVTMGVTAGDTTVHVALTADQIDSVLSSLARFRGRMTPPIAPELPAGRRFGAVFDPRYRIATDTKTAAATLVVRHPGFGWIGYLFPSRAAAGLRAYFQRQAQGLQ